MSFFRRRVEPPAESRQAPNGAPEQELVDGALDTLAQLLRVFGRKAFALEGEAVEAFGERCELWARHVLTGAELEAAAEADAPAFRTERGWPALRQFFAERRTAEARFVEQRVGELKGALWDLLRGLRSLAGAGQAAQDKVGESLNTLEEAVRKDSLEAVRDAVGTTVAVIRGALEEQRARIDHELATMGRRLASMREELLEARRQMAIDPLTQVYNRGAFDGALERYQTLSVLSGQPLTMLMADIDHFKAVNDTRGHPAGDAVLREFADRIVKTFPRRNDFVARYGGEEFVVLLFDVDVGQGEQLAQRLLQRVREADFALDPPLRLSCSVGYAQLKRGEEAAAFLQRVDRALYRAKHAGRDCAVSADSETAQDLPALHIP